MLAWRCGNGGAQQLLLRRTMCEAAPAKRVWKKRDHILKGHSVVQRAALIHNTTAIAEAQARFHLSPTATLLLGQAMTFASLLSSFLKGEERIVIDVTASGPVQRIYAEAVQAGEIRGFVSNPLVRGDVREALGKGTLRARKVLYNSEQPYDSVVEIQGSHLQSTFQHLLDQSDQISSKVLVQTSVSPNGTVGFSGGFMTQIIADTPVTTDWTNSLQRADEIHLESALVDADYDSKKVLGAIVSGLDLPNLRRTPVDFYCRCSLDGFKRTLTTLPREEVHSMQEMNHRDLTCQFCNKSYQLSDQDFGDILRMAHEAAQKRAQNA